MLSHNGITVIPIYQKYILVYYLWTFFYQNVIIRIESNGNWSRDLEHPLYTRHKSAVIRLWRFVCQYPGFELVGVPR